MVLSVPVPSSSVNCNSFFDFGTATHSLTFTARKSDLLNVSKSTNSSNKGSTFTLEKSIFSDSVFTFFQVLQKLYYLHHFSYLHHLRTSLWGRKQPSFQSVLNLLISHNRSKQRFFRNRYIPINSCCFSVDWSTNWCKWCISFLSSSPKYSLLV